MIEEILAGSSLMEHWFGPFSKKPYEPIWVDVTSKCPTCGKDWTRKRDFNTMIMGECLVMCNECCPGDIVLVGNNKVWPSGGLSCIFG